MATEYKPVYISSDTPELTRLAEEVQRSFLPLTPPSVDGYEFFAHYESAQEVGGDYYDFIPLPNKRTAMMLGDGLGFI